MAMIDSGSQDPLSDQERKAQSVIGRIQDLEKNLLHEKQMNQRLRELIMKIHETAFRPEVK